MPFLVPFSDSRSIDMQGFVLLVIGLVGWLMVGLSYKIIANRLSTLEKVLLCVFIFFCVASLVANPHKAYDILGAPYIRLGSAGLTACIGCGLALSRVSTKRLISSLYSVISAIALLSLPFSWYRYGSFTRIGGLFSQADIFAVILGCGLLLGFAVIKLYPRYRLYIGLMEIYMLVLLMLTQTRAALVLVGILFLYLIWQSRTQLKLSKLKWVAIICGLILVIIGAKLLLPTRVTNTSYAYQSISYRLSLQKYALKSVETRPYLGYGPGNLADSLACNKLDSSTLQKSCKEGYFFNSSHNIFIDRLLAIGIIGGLAYLTFVIIEITKGLRSDRNTQILALCALLITAYYLTNVTSISLELLFWIILLHVAIKSNVTKLTS